MSRCCIWSRQAETDRVPSCVWKVHLCHTNLCHRLWCLFQFLTWASLTAGIILPVVVPPIRERFYKPDVRNPPPFKQVGACLLFSVSPHREYFV